MGHFCTWGLLIKCCWVVLHGQVPIVFSSVSYLRCFSVNSGNRRRANAWTLHISWLDWSAFLTEDWLWQKTTDRRQSELAGELGECQLHGGRHNQAWKSWESSWRRGGNRSVGGELILLYIGSNGLLSVCCFLLHSNYSLSTCIDFRRDRFIRYTLFGVFCMVFGRLWCPVTATIFPIWLSLWGL